MCEIILNLGQWIRRRCCLNIFIFLALLDILFSRAEPIVQFLIKVIRGIIHVQSFKNLPVVQAEMLYKEKVNI